MERYEIIEKIGREFYSSNLENGEFSYSKALNSIGKSISDYRNSNSKKIITIWIFVLKMIG